MFAVTFSASPSRAAVCDSAAAADVAFAFSSCQRPALSRLHAQFSELYWARNCRTFSALGMTQLPLRFCVSGG